MRTIHDVEEERRAMARLAMVRNHRTDSRHVDGLHASADGRQRVALDACEKGSFWHVRLHYQGRHLLTRYSMGTAHREPPKCDDVLANLCMDASGYDNARTFEEWAGEYGYDTDSRKAEAMYRLVAEGAKALRQLLGADYDDVVARGCREWEAEV